MPAAGWHGQPIRRALPRRGMALAATSPAALELSLGGGYGRSGGSGAVRELQRVLLGLGYAAGPADGLFGPRTQAALAWFQIKHGVPPTGIADATTLRIVGRRDRARSGDPRPGRRRRAPVPALPRGAARPATAPATPIRRAANARRLGRDRNAAARPAARRGRRPAGCWCRRSPCGACAAPIWRRAPVAQAAAASRLRCAAPRRSWGPRGAAPRVTPDRRAERDRLRERPGRSRAGVDARGDRARVLGAGMEAGLHGPRGCLDRVRTGTPRPRSRSRWTDSRRARPPAS